MFPPLLPDISEWNLSKKAEILFLKEGCDTITTEGHWRFSWEGAAKPFGPGDAWNTAEELWEEVAVVIVVVLVIVVELVVAAVLVKKQE